jgi:glycosyltransferase involved in cell wall biosynthesis
MITILTPTYNRANTLPRLFKSLCAQTNFDFNWLVVDDGSTDGTAELIAKYKVSSPFDIELLSKENGGKHSALNLGFGHKKREWTLILDSDDWLVEGCVACLVAETEATKADVDSISFLKIYEDGQVVGSKFPVGMNTYLERIQRRVAGDKADLFRSRALAAFRFPEFEGETFMAESPFFLWFGSQHKTRFVNYEGYVCEYQIDGLTANSVPNRYRNILSTSYVYSVQYAALAKLSQARAAINWWRFHSSASLKRTSFRPPLIFMPFGRSLSLLDVLRGKRPAT